LLISKNFERKYIANLTNIGRENYDMMKRMHGSKKVWEPLGTIDLLHYDFGAFQYVSAEIEVISIF